MPTGGERLITTEILSFRAISANWLVIFVLLFRLQAGLTECWPSFSLTDDPFWPVRCK